MRPRPDKTRSRVRLGAMAWSVGLAMLAAVSVARAEDGAQPDASTVKRSQQNLNFQLPPDWPIERRGGIVGPIPVEEYLAMKFKALDSRLQGLEQQVNGFDVRLRVIEEALKKPPSGLKSSESQ